jgi:hypothetical protein
MSDTIEPMPDRIDQQQLAQQLVEAARADGVELVGPGGLLSGLTKTVLETALEAEMSEHLGYDRHDPVGRDGGNSRNGTRTKTVLTEIGPVQIEVPRDRDASFSPTIVRKRQRRLDGIDEIVLSLTARGLTTGEVAAHFDQVYGATVSKDTISRITDKVIEEMTEWQNRPLDAGRILVIVANLVGFDPPFPAADFLTRRAIAQAEPGAIIEFGSDRVKFVGRGLPDVGSLRQVLSQESVRVLVRSSLPRRVRVGEVYLQSSPLLNHVVVEHLVSLIPGQRSTQAPWQFPEGLGERACHGGRRISQRERNEDGEAGLALDEGRDRPAADRAEDQVPLPVPDLSA